MARKLGVGQRLGIDLPGEKPGLAPTRDWKLATLGKPWQVGETLIQPASARVTSWRRRCSWRL